MLLTAVCFHPLWRLVHVPSQLRVWNEGDSRWKLVTMAQVELRGELKAAEEEEKSRRRRERDGGTGSVVVKSSGSAAVGRAC